MNIINAYKKRIRFLGVIVLISSIIGALMGFIVSTSQHYPFTIFIAKGVILSVLITHVVSSFEFVIFPYLLRRLPFIQSLILRSISYTLLTIIIFLLVSLAFTIVLPMSFQIRMLLPAVGIMFIAFFISNFIISINRLLGGRLLIEVILGRYRMPVIEKRAFMFLDLKSSTTISEKIGNIAFHQFLSEFIIDVTGPIIESRGEIHKYVGDEIIAVWKLRDLDRNAEIILSYFNILSSIEKLRAGYESRFGFIPEFRAGMHCGSVVAGEIGESKKEIAFLGDVMNTTARIEEECKTSGAGLLVSEDLLKEIKLPKNLIANSIGSIKLRGKAQSVNLFTVNKT